MKNKKIKKKARLISNDKVLCYYYFHSNKEIYIEFYPFDKECHLFKTNLYTVMSIFRGNINSFPEYDSYFYLNGKDFGWRFWENKPSKKQMKNTPWPGIFIDRRLTSGRGELIIDNIKKVIDKFKEYRHYCFNCPYSIYYIN